MLPRTGGLWIASALILAEKNWRRGRQGWRPRKLRSSKPEQLLSHAFDGVGAERRVFSTDLAQFLKLWVVTPGLEFFHAVPDLHNGAFRRCAIQRSHGLCAGPPVPPIVTTAM